jgi:N-acetylglutamate synthase-like GNAT family acetyltransferase
MLIRQATQADIDMLTILANKMVDTTLFTRISRERIAKILEVPTAVVFVAEAKEVVGFICGVLHDQFFTQQKFANDMALFVDPVHRGSSAAFRLIKAFENWAKEKGVSHIWLGQSVGQNIDSTAEFYSRLGYTLAGVNTVKEVKG